MSNPRYTMSNAVAKRTAKWIAENGAMNVRYADIVRYLKEEESFASVTVSNMRDLTRAWHDEEYHGLVYLMASLALADLELLREKHGRLSTACHEIAEHVFENPSDWLLDNLSRALANHTPEED